MRKITRIKCLIVVLLTFIGTLAPVHAQQSGNFEISGVVKDTSGEPDPYGQALPYALPRVRKGI